MSDADTESSSSQEPSDDEHDSLDARIDALIEAGEHMPDDIAEPLIEAGPDATERLIDVMCDEELGHGRARGDGWAPIHAAHVLAERGDTDAIEPMVELLRGCESGEALQSELVERLQTFDEAAFEPVMEVVEETDDHDVLHAMLEVAAHLGVEDEGLYEALLDFFEADPELGAELLGACGDERALEPLYEKLDATEVDASGQMMANQSIIEIGEAIRQLDGNPPEHLLEKFRLVKRRRQRGGGGLERLLQEFGGANEDDDSSAPAESRDLGRNEPCWCGSGQKYKHCHWRDDRRQKTKKRKK